MILSQVNCLIAMLRVVVGRSGLDDYLYRLGLGLQVGSASLLLRLMPIAY